MKIAILSKEQDSYSTKRLLEEAQNLGLSLDVVDLRHVYLQFSQSGHDLYYQSKIFPFYDVVIPRIGVSLTYTGMMVLSELESQGSKVMNTATSIGLSRDKLKALQQLSWHQVPIPKTIFIGSKSDIQSSLSQLSPPYIIKILEGTQGQGVMFAESMKSAESIIQTLFHFKQPVLLQEFIKESKGRDIRVFVINGKVLAAMRRTAAGDEFRSNVHMGASVEAVSLTDHQQAVAIAAAKTLGLSIAGVDLLESKTPLVIEVNSSPGLQGIEQATQVNVAKEILKASVL